MMKFQDLTEQQIVEMLTALQLFFDGDFLYPEQVHYQTGYDMETSEYIANHIRVLGEIKFQKL
jgi:hypothetical protein